MSNRAYCFTLNNPVSNELPENPNIRYIIWQLERGEAGTLHLQGYLELNTPRRAAYVRKWLPGAHVEERKGTREQAKAYCSKEDTRVEGPWEKGNWEAGGVGTRTDLLRIKEKLDSGVSTELIASDQAHFETWCKYRGAFNEYKKIRTSPRTWKTEVHVYWGESGTGKSTRAQSMAPNAYWKTNDEYWDGYNGEEDIIIDDFYGWIRYDILLRLLDRYPMDVNARYGHRRLAAKRIFITSNKRPEDWYPNIEDKKPLLRRIDSITHYRELIK